MTGRSLTLMLLIPPLLGACGASLPIQSLAHPEGPKFNNFVYSIFHHVNCELSRSLKANALNKRRYSLLDKWAVKIALDLKVIDEGSAGPNLSAINTPATFTFGLAGQYKVDATRDMNVTYFLTVHELLAQDDPDALDANGDPRPCAQSPQDDSIAGDLGINQTITASLQSYDRLALLSEHITNGPYDTVSHHVTFAVQVGATATPTWKLVPVSANTSGTFLGANRTATDDLVITLGPTELGSRKTDATLRGIPIGGSSLDQSFFIERLKSISSRAP